MYSDVIVPVRRDEDAHLDGWIITHPHAHICMSLAGDVFLRYVDTRQGDPIPTRRGQQEEIGVHTLIITLWRTWLKSYLVHTQFKVFIN